MSDSNSTNTPVSENEVIKEQILLFPLCRDRSSEYVSFAEPTETLAVTEPNPAQPDMFGEEYFK